MNQQLEVPATPTPPLSSRWRGATLLDYRGRILLAEDDADTRDLVTEALEADGHQVVEVADGRRLLECLASEAWPPHRGRPFDLLITDLRMPGWSGIPSITHLRSAHWMTPVILMTAFGESETRSAAESVGAVLFTKPFDIDDLRTAVLFLLRKREIE